MIIRWNGEHSSEAVVEICITPKHILMGKIGECSRCPVALALIEILTSRYLPIVDHDTIFIFDKTRQTESHEIPINGVPTHFIKTFDECRDVEPTTFSLSLPIWMLNDTLRAQAQNDFEAQLELAHEAKIEREAIERAQSKCGLSRQEEWEQAVLRG